jgi:hypothetical protein
MYELDDAIRIRDEVEDAFESTVRLKQDFDDIMTQLSQLVSQAQRLHFDDQADEFPGELDDIIQDLSNLIDGMDEIRSELSRIEL